jgi:hypothetical protein
MENRGIKVPDVIIYDTCEDMMVGTFPGRWQEVWKEYKAYIEGDYYKDSSSKRTYKAAYSPPSAKPNIGILGLGTRPKVSACIEGHSMWDFTYTVLHEMAHVYYDTRNECVCDSFALLYNNLFWTPACTA